MYKFTDKEVRTYFGEEASRRMSERNDQQFLTDQGIIAVDESRWKEAQYYERKTWMEVNLCRDHDHNIQNKNDLGGYSYLSGKSFNKVIEVGCGPFTNLLHILPLINASEVYLLDPLIISYLGHPNCKYSNRFLGEKPVNLIASSIEDFQTPLSFDLVVIINVLQHCKDAFRVLSNIRNILSPNGILVFHEPCFKMQALKEFYDAGHPLLVSYEFLNDFLNGFKKIYRNEFSRGDQEFDKYICFSGTKI
jgi:SAM-dependent methyltransferase